MDRDYLIISTVEDMDRLAGAGAGAYLVGESLVVSDDPEAALARLVKGAGA